MTQLLRQKLKLDEKIVDHNYNHGDNRVAYWIYHDDGKSDKPEKIYVPKNIDAEFPNSRASAGRGNDAWCFSSVPNIFSNDKSLNRIYYPVEEDEGQPKLTIHEKRRFIELCKEHNMFPKYIDVDDCMNHQSQPGVPVFVFKTEDENTREPINLSLMYVYLCCARYFREDTGFVRALVYLVDKIQMDFHAAFILATRVCQNYTIHHFISCNRTYGSAHNANSVKDVPMKQIIGLKWFMKNPFSFDNNTVHSNSGNFRTMGKIAAKSKIDLMCTAQMLMDPVLIEAMDADSDDKAAAKIKEWKSIKDNLKYVDEPIVQEVCLPASKTKKKEPKKKVAIKKAKKKSILRDKYGRFVKQKSKEVGA